MAAPSTPKERNVKHLSLVHAGAVALAALVPALAAAETLDGRSFQGVFLERGKTSGDADTLVFKNGRFRSSACDKYDYGDATYKTTTVGDSVRFEAETSSPKYGKLNWAGVVRGPKLDATVMMEQKGKPAIENWVVAAEKK
jgi:hypothetical protein